MRRPPNSTRTYTLFPSSSLFRVLCERFGCVGVLKGAGTVVAAPGRIACIIDAGNPGMAVGGRGDVLTGVIAALRAQGLDASDAARCGADRKSTRLNSSH